MRRSIQRPSGERSAGKRQGLWDSSESRPEPRAPRRSRPRRSSPRSTRAFRTPESSPENSRPRCWPVDSVVQELPLQCRQWTLLGVSDQQGARTKPRMRPLGGVGLTLDPAFDSECQPSAPASATLDRRRRQLRQFQTSRSVSQSPARSVAPCSTRSIRTSGCVRLARTRPYCLARSRSRRNAAESRLRRSTRSIRMPA